MKQHIHNDKKLDTQYRCGNSNLYTLSDQNYKEIQTNTQLYGDLTTIIIRKNINNLNNSSNQPVPTDIYRKLYPINSL